MKQNPKFMYITQGSRKMKILGGEGGGTAQDGTFMYSYMSVHICYNHKQFSILDCMFAF